ncbi:hypothetical protein [Floccifex sp.]|uniref:hypothetical protein n=1 Tax=Floccifex sp. TaxID=2815810 RepID=UPI003F0A78B6
MKKKRTLRASSLLMALTLATTSFVGGTFAKYVTEASYQTSARVAYWGFFETDLQTGPNALFSESYDNVASEDDSLVVAPGTNGETSFQFRYKPNRNTAEAPEVGYTFTVDTTGSECPVDHIQWALNDGDFGSFNDLLTQIKTLSGDVSGTKVYAPGELPVNFDGTNVHTIKWKWDFTGDTAYDTDDTTRANYAILDNVVVKINVKAVQID